MNIPTTSSTDPLSRTELVKEWTEAYGHPPQKGLSTRLLRLACGYNTQVQKHGGLKKASLRELMSYLEISKSKKRSTRRQKQTTKPVVGTRLVRQWKGDIHVVDIQEKGVLYRDRTYNSLSQVARVITGVRWSGPRFFGV